MRTTGRRKPYGPADLACPDCRGPLSASLKCAKCGHKFAQQAGYPALLPSDLPDDIRQSISAWNAQWAKLKGPSFKALEEEYHRDYLDETLRQLLAWVDPAEQRRFLEIGCGPAVLGAELAARGFEVAGLDCCVEALKVAGGNFKSKRLKGFFLGGDLNHLPLKDGSVDFLYGGGVIEHFRDTTGALRELARVLSPGGVSFNTVPYFSVGSLTYRQLWGNIPELPGLRQLFELLHIRLLGGGHMKYGYEMSFTEGRIRKAHLDAGFSRVEVRKFDVFLPFHQLPEAFKPAARRLAKWRPFWPMIVAVGIK